MATEAIVSTLTVLTKARLIRTDIHHRLPSEIAGHIPMAYHKTNMMKCSALIKCKLK